MVTIFGIVIKRKICMVFISDIALKYWNQVSIFGNCQFSQFAYHDVTKIGSPMASISLTPNETAMARSFEGRQHGEVPQATYSLTCLPVAEERG